MTVAIRVDGIPSADYQQLIDRYRSQRTTLPPGAELSVATELDDRVDVVALWESRGAFDHFRQEWLEPMYDELGIRMPEPRYARLVQATARPAPSIDVDKGVTDLFARLQDAWAAKDPAALADCFEPEGRLIRPWGDDLQGRDAIREAMGGLLEDRMRGTTMRVDVQSIRRLGRDTALVDGTQTILEPDGSTRLTLHAVGVVAQQHQDGTYLMLDYRPYVMPDQEEFLGPR